MAVSKSILAYISIYTNAVYTAAWIQTREPSESLATFMQVSLAWSYSKVSVQEKNHTHTKFPHPPKKFLSEKNSYSCLDEFWCSTFRSTCKSIGSVI